MSIAEDLKPYNEAVPADLPEDPGVSYMGSSRPTDAALGNGRAEGSEDVIDTHPRVLPPVLPEAEKVEAIRIHHRYTLSRQLGKGAQGEVWQATQEALQRRVAIKRIPPGTPADDGPGLQAEIRRIEQFRQEALVAGSLEHPNIIPVHDLVTDAEGRPVLVMKEVRGKPWLEVLNRTIVDEEPDFLGRHIPILMAVTQAVAFAHSRGVIHRDLKPAQVMIGEFGEVLLTDWGLAMVLPALIKGKEDSHPSIPKGILGYFVNPAGTPAYMAPEQASGGVEGLGPWTDIFLLGGILYYLLTGTPPYAASHSKAALLMARRCAVDPPEERAPDMMIPSELSRLAMRALSPDPAQRIASATDFHAALEDYLSGAGKRRESQDITDQVQERCRQKAGYAELAASQAAIARAEGLWSGNPQLRTLRRELTIRFADLALANKDLVLAQIQGEILGDTSQGSEVLAKVEKLRVRQSKSVQERQLALRGLGLFLILFLLAMGLYIRVEVRARDEAEVHRVKAREAQARTEAARATAVKERNSARREQYLSGIGFADGSLRDGRVDKALEILLHGVPAELRQAEWGHLLSETARDDMVLLRGTELPKTIYRAEFSPDGKRIVTAQRDGTISVWETNRGLQIYERRLPLEKLWIARFSPDGDRILVTSFDGEALILDAADGEPRVTLRGDNPQKSIMRGGAFSPDGLRVAATFSDKTVCVWNAGTGAIQTVIRMPQIPYEVTFTPDGTRLAIAMLERGQAVLADSSTGEIIRTFAGHRSSCYSVALSRDGRSLVTTSRDLRIRIFDVESGSMVKSIPVAESRPNQAAFTPDGACVAVATEAGAALLFDTFTGQPLGRVHAAPEMYAISFEPSGQRMLTTSFSEVRLWRLNRVLNSPVPEVAILPPGEKPEKVRQVSFPLDREIIWRDRDGPWMTSAPATLFRTDIGSYAVEPFGTVTSPDATQQIELGYAPQPARVLRLTHGTSQTLSAKKDVFNATFSPSGRLAAIGTYDGTATVWDTETWQEVDRIQTGAGAVWSLDFTPDEKLLALGCHSGEIFFWDLEAKRSRFRIIAHEAQRPVVMVRFNSDGKMLVTSSSDRRAKIWSSDSGKELATLSGHAKALISGVFSPDGRRVLTTSFDNTAKLWDTETGREMITLFTARGERYLMTGGFSRDGRRVFFTTDKRELFEQEILPWDEAELPASIDTPFAVRLELWKRQRRLHPDCRLEDIVWNR